MENKIIITLTDDHSKIRNEGLGDYYIDSSNNVQILAYLKDDKSYNEAWLIAMHELIEQRLTEHRNILETDIDTFDRKFIESRSNADEAGNEPNCIYRKEHRFAENIERQLAYELEIDWFNYYNNYQI